MRMICTSGLATVGLFTSTQSYPSPDSTTTTTTTSATTIATTTTQEPSATPHHDIATLDGVLSGSGSTITTINANNYPVCCRCLVRRNSDWSQQQLTFMCVHPSTPSSSPPVRRRRACETRVAHTLRRVGDEMYLRRMPLSHLVALYLCQVLPGEFGRNTLSRWLCPQQEGRANMEGNEKEMEKEKAEEE